MEKPIIGGSGVGQYFWTVVIQEYDFLEYDFLEYDFLEYDFFWHLVGVCPYNYIHYLYYHNYYTVFIIIIYLH